MNATLYNNTTCIIWAFHESLSTRARKYKEDFEISSIIIPTILIPTGLIFALIGHQILKPTLMITGALFGMFGFLHGASSRKDLISCNATGIALLVVGVVFAFIARSVVGMALFVAGALAGGAMCHYVFVFFPELEDTYADGGIFWEHSLIPYWICVLFVSVATGIVTVHNEKRVIKLITSALGGFLVAIGIDMLYNENTWISVSSGLVVTVIGAVVQYKKLIRFKKRKTKYETRADNV